MSKSSVDSEKIFFNNQEVTQLLTELLPIAIYMTDAKGVITYYNKQAEILWGRSPKLNDPDESKYFGCYKIFDTDGNYLPHDESPMAQALKTQKSIRDKEITIVKPDFSLSSALVHIDPIFNEDKKLIGAINILFDITERKRIERDVYHLAAIVENSEDAIIGKNLGGEIVSWNKGAERIFGYSRDEVLGKNITILIPEERIDEEIHIINNIRAGKKVDHFDTVRVRKGGETIDISLTVSPIKNDAGKVIGASKIARNVTERVEIQSKLKKYNEELKKLNQYKDDFISRASHELKTPLTVVKAYLELLKEMAAEEEKPYLNKTLLHTDKLHGLINEMLDVSKMQSNKIVLNPTNFLIDDLMRECINSIKVISPDIKLHYKISNPSLKIFADKDRLEQVVINLLTNAIKYSPGKSDVFLNVNNSSKEVEVDVIDQGMGIPEGDTKKVFNRFFRMDGMNSNISGLGIGLYISRQVIKKHKGKIWVKKSIPGKGTTFSFTIPLIDKDQEKRGDS